MAEPISDERLLELRELVFPIGLPTHCRPASMADVYGLITRLDRAESKLAQIARLTAPKNYLSLATLITLKEIVDG